jgi:hypothetical protein
MLKSCNAHDPTVAWLCSSLCSKPDIRTLYSRNQCFPFDLTAGLGSSLVARAENTWATRALGALASLAGVLAMLVQV